MSSKHQGQASKKDKGSIIENPEVLQEQVLGLESLAEKYGKILMIITVIIALGLGGTYGYQFYNKGQESKAQSALFSAQMWFEKDSLDLALEGKMPIPGFKTITEKYPNTKAGQLAQYYIGVIYLKKNDYDNAIEQLSNLNFDDYLLSSRTKALLGDAYAEKEDLENAAKYYKEAAQTNQNSILSIDYLKKACITLETLGRVDEVIALYKDIITKYPKATEINTIKKELSRLTQTPHF